jgi:hypothetical protein
MGRLLLLALFVAALPGAARARGYDLHGTWLVPNTHVYFIDPTAPLCSPATICANCGPGGVQDWIEATILAAQEWSDPLVTGADFRYVFGGFIFGSLSAPRYPANVSVVTLGISCVGYPSAIHNFQTCMFADVPFDVSGSPPLGCFDLQGSSVHQMGHALGLNHTTVPGASMYTLSVDAMDFRTIEPDDIQGVQAIYGPLPANVPVLDYQGVPFTGRTISLRLLNVAGIGWIGFDTDPGPTSPLGFPIELGLTPDFFAVPTLTPATFPLAIPPFPSVAGLAVYAQALSFTLPGGVLTIQVSNPLRVVIPY